MKDSLDTNRQFWNELTDINWRSQFYCLDEFKQGQQTLHDVELDLLGNVNGKSILHLQCHFGMDSLSLARLGAAVTGADFSDHAIARARQLGEEIGVPAEFICSDVYRLSEVLAKKFDIVFTSLGVLCWLHDLPAWAKIVSHFLLVGGTFVLVEEHPLSFILDEKSEQGNLRIAYDYFEEGAISLNEEGTYADRSARLEHKLHYEWMHNLDEIMSSIMAAGLKIESYHEYPFTMFQRFEWLVKNDNGWWQAPDGKLKLPMLFSLKCRKE